MPPRTTPPITARPAPQRLATAKLALLQDAEPVRHSTSTATEANAATHAVLQTIREKPLLAMGGAALLGLFLFRKNFFFKRVLTMAITRLGMNAIKQLIR